MLSHSLDKQRSPRLFSPAMKKLILLPLLAALSLTACQPRDAELVSDEDRGKILPFGKNDRARLPGLSSFGLANLMIELQAQNLEHIEWVDQESRSIGEGYNSEGSRRFVNEGVATKVNQTVVESKGTVLATKDVNGQQLSLLWAGAEVTAIDASGTVKLQVLQANTLVKKLEDGQLNLVTLLSGLVTLEANSKTVQQSLQIIVSAKWKDSQIIDLKGKAYYGDLNKPRTVEVILPEGQVIDIVRAESGCYLKKGAVKVVEPNVTRDLLIAENEVSIQDAKVKWKRQLGQCSVRPAINPLPLLFL